MLDSLWNIIMLKRKKVSYGEKLRIKGRIYIHGNKGKIVFGDRVTINSTENVNPTSGFNHSHFRTEGEGEIQIGNNVGLSQVNITSYSNVSIEDDVLIGSGVKIWDTDFHPIDYLDRKKGLPAKHESIYIEQGAFIGACSIILKGVRIGCHSVVGAGSVVTKSIPSGEIWGGVPAKYIKSIGD